MQTLIHCGGSLDRALYTPCRANIIGAIRGGAYVKLPREGNWLKQPRIFPKADDRKTGEPFTLQHCRRSNAKLFIIEEISLISREKPNSLLMTQDLHLYQEFEEQ
jgi:hypothetical protein